jgi:hypothetical protein
MDSWTVHGPPVKNLYAKVLTFVSFTMRLHVPFFRWLNRLESLIIQVNEKFQHFFGSMGFAGEVQLHRGNSENDFANYGINILVKFRENMPLQKLDPFRQSGKFHFTAKRHLNIKVIKGTLEPRYRSKYLVIRPEIPARLKIIVSGLSSLLGSMHYLVIGPKSIATERFTDLGKLNSLILVMVRL